MANKTTDPLEAAKSKTTGQGGSKLPPLPPQGAPLAGTQDPAATGAGAGPGEAAGPAQDPSNGDPTVGPAMPPIDIVVEEAPRRPLRVFRALRDARMAWHGHLITVTMNKEYTEQKFGAEWADHAEHHMQEVFELIN